MCILVQTGCFSSVTSRDHRPDLPQVKIKLSALDPLALPLGITRVGGQRADDGLYVPAIQQVQQTLGQKGLLYVGDCKMAALPTRAYVQQSGDYYLCPLSGVQMSAATLQQLVAPVQANTQALTTIERESEEGSREAIAVGYEYTQPVSLTQDGQTIQWDERVLVVRSLKWRRRSRPRCSNDRPKRKPNWPSSTSTNANAARKSCSRRSRCADGGGDCASLPCGGLAGDGVPRAVVSNGRCVAIATEQQAPAWSGSESERAGQY